MASQWGETTGVGVHVYPCGCVIEGYKSVALYTEETVKVRHRKGTVTVTGCDLRIEKICRDEMYVAGKIRAVCYE